MGPAGTLLIGAAWRESTAVAALPSARSFPEGDGVGAAAAVPGPEGLLTAREPEPEPEPEPESLSAPDAMGGSETTPSNEARSFSAMIWFVLLAIGVVLPWALLSALLIALWRSRSGLALRRFLRGKPKAVPTESD